MKKYSLFVSIFFAGLLLSCGESGDKSDKGTMNADSAYSGLEGTRDQSGQLSTDVKPDTSGGQAKTEMITGTDSSSKSKASNADADFLKEQVEGNYDELRLARLASTKSSDKEIKSIAGYLVDDHSKALDKLRKISDRTDTKVPAESSDVANSTFTSLDNKKANQFDKAWCETLIDKHKKTIEKYESASKRLSDPELKSFVTETLPKLRMHLDKLMAYHGQVKS